jgi:hypothetical protein
LRGFVVGGIGRIEEREVKAMWFTEKGKSKAGASTSNKGRKREFPIRPADYELLEPIGDGGTAIVHRARCLPLDGEVVAVKIMNMSQRTESDVVCMYVCMPYFSISFWDMLRR